MKVVRILLLLLSAVCGLSLYAAQSDLDRLDGYVARRAEYVARKQHSIDRIKAQLRPSMTAVERLAIYDRLFEAYYTVDRVSTQQLFSRQLPHTPRPPACYQWLL